MTKFIGHGSFEAELRGKVLVFKATGPWNVESLNNTIHEFPELSAPLYGSPWGLVGDFYGEPIHVPEAAEKLIEIVRFEKEKGRVATGIVVSHCDMPLLGKQHLTEIYTKAEENFQFFDSVDDAITWVESEIKRAQ